MDWTDSARQFLTSRQFPALAGAVVGGVAGAVVGGGVGAVPGAAAGSALGKAIDESIRGPVSEGSSTQQSGGALPPIVTAVPKLGETVMNIAVLQDGQFLGYLGELPLFRTVPPGTVAIVQSNDNYIAVLESGARKVLSWQMV